MHGGLARGVRHARSESVCRRANGGVTIEADQESGEFVEGAAPCVSCGRATLTFTCTLRAKCAHCSERLDDDGLGITLDGDPFHQDCWRQLISMKFASPAH